MEAPQDHDGHSRADCDAEENGDGDQPETRAIFDRVRLTEAQHEGTDKRMACLAVPAPAKLAPENNIEVLHHPLRARI